MLLAAIAAPADTLIYRGNFIYSLSDAGNAKLYGVYQPERLKGQLDVPLYFDFNGNTYNCYSVGSKSFLGCRDITSIVFYTNKIGDENDRIYFNGSLFKSCENLKTVDFSNAYAELDWDILDECRSIENLIIRAESIPECEYLFGSTAPFDAVLYVPSALKSSYEALTGYNKSFWSRFSEIKAMDDFSQTEPVRGRNPLPDSTERSDIYSFEVASGYNAGNYGLSGLLPRDYSGEVITPSFLYLPDQDKYGVIDKVADMCFASCPNITEVVIDCDPSLTKFAMFEGAFVGCERLTKVTLPNQLMWIYRDMFGSCQKLKTVVLGADKVIDLLEEQPVDLSKIALYVNPDHLDGYIDAGWDDVFGRVLPIGCNEGENVKFSLDGFELEFHHLMASQSIAFDGCRIEEAQNDEYIVNAARLTIAKPGGMRIAAFPSESQEAITAPHIIINGASMKLSNLDAGDVIDLTIAPSSKIEFAQGCEITETSVGKFRVRISDTDSFAIKAIGDSDAALVSQNSPVSYYIEGNYLTVTGLKDDDRISVYNASGCLLHASSAKKIALPDHGVYIVATPSGAFKIMF